MAPEHRIWMEVATEALQNSGLLQQVKGKSVGVFVAASEIQYDRVDHDNEGLSVVGRMASMLPTRIAYQYDFKGPAVLVDTACSSGIVAIDHAVDAIHSGRLVS
ncbi:unnamed protein product [Sphagnum jensenii]|uniref:Ketosynthase family 3 (KS3) domain-containing protein n=1 Tax=Sphagnum jensenii TaxID=128206 RepID=A0ABP0VGX5_9BRYO